MFKKFNKIKINILKIRIELKNNLNLSVLIWGKFLKYITKIIKGNIETLKENSSIYRVAVIDPTSSFISVLGIKKKKIKKYRNKTSYIIKIYWAGFPDKFSTKDQAAYILRKKSLSLLKHSDLYK